MSAPNRSLEGAQRIPGMMDACRSPDCAALRLHPGYMVLVLLLFIVGTVEAASVPALVDSMRGTTPLADETTPPPLQNQENKDVRRTRAFAWQPPTIPHRIDGYQVDRQSNKCMTCHARSRIEETKAIPVSATHYMDRDGTIRGDVSPRRYFCTTCHVPQDEVKPLVNNTYQDFEAVRTRETTRPAAKGGPGKQ